MASKKRKQCFCLLEISTLKFALFFVYLIHLCQKDTNHWTLSSQYLALMLLIHTFATVDSW